MRELPYRNTVAWQKAHALGLAVEELAQSPGLAREWEMRRQLVSAAWSVGANIAEGHGRGTNPDFAAFVDRARGSLFEVDHWLLAARDTARISDEQYSNLHGPILELNAMLHAMLKRLREAPSRRAT